jgi:oligopeptide transport system substrate-binding protein
MRRGLVVAAIAALAVSAPACGVGSKLTYPKPTEAATPGGVLTIGIVQPGSIDPGQASDADGQLVVSTMCDPLVEIDPATGTATAGLAKHIVPEEKGTGVTITLKDGLRFSDGKGVSVADVRASLSRIASDTLASPLADELRPIAGFNLVHGDVGDKVRLSEDDPARTTLLGVAQVTNTVFTVGILTEDPEYVLQLARPWTAIVPKRLALDPKFGRRPVCVGPYRMTADWKPGDPEILLERNPFYKRPNELYTTGGRGYPDRIRFRAYADREAVYQAFVRGEVDVARLSREHLAAPPAGARIGTAATPAMEYVGMPTSLGIYRNARVRAALSVALDRPALVQRLGRHDRVPATGVLPPTMPVPGDRPTCAPLAQSPPDLGFANELLGKAGVDLHGVEVPLYFNDDPGSGNKELMEAVGAQWQAAFGIVPKLMPLTWEQYRERGTGTLGFDGPFRLSWRSTTSAPAAFLKSQLAGSAVGSTNLTRFSSPAFDSAFNHGLEEEDDPKSRARLLGRLVDIVCGAVPFVPVWSGAESFAVRDTVGAADGRLQRPTTGQLNVRELYVRTAAR